MCVLACSCCVVVSSSLLYIATVARVAIHSYTQRNSKWQQQQWVLPPIWTYTTQGQNGIEREHTNTRNLGKGPATQGHSSPPRRSRIKEKDEEQASTQLRNHTPAEHTSTIALLL